MEALLLALIWPLEGTTPHDRKNAGAIKHLKTIDRMQAPL
jgi:hypothetical protein